jgi:hypothetical protein
MSHCIDKKWASRVANGMSFTRRPPAFGFGFGWQDSQSQNDGCKPDKQRIK